MDDPMYNLQDTEHNDHLQTAINSINSGEPDLCIITRDGDTIDTWRSLVCIYSSSVARYISNIPCCTSTNISLPVSALAVRNLLKVLVDGVVRVDALEKLKLPEVAEAAKLLGIDLENIFIGSSKDESFNMSVKTEPEVKQGKIKKKIKKLKEKKEKKIIVKEEPNEELQLDSEKLLQEDESVGQEEEEIKSKNNLTDESKPPKGILPKAKPTCNQCGKLFNDEWHLNRHTLSHTGEKPYGCDQCEKFYKTKDGLKSHQKRAHNVNLGNFGDESLLGGDPAPKPFVCDMCGKGFGKKENLRRHGKSHNYPGEIDFMCTQCGQQFLERREFNKHIDSCGNSKDTTQIMFNCNLCLQRFPEAKLVVEHLKEHQQAKEQGEDLQNVGRKISHVKEEVDSRAENTNHQQTVEEVDSQLLQHYLNSQVEEEMDLEDGEVKNHGGEENVYKDDVNQMQE